MKIQSTESIHQGPIRVVVYGKQGHGKTSLAKTLDNPIVLSLENGLRSLSGTKIAFLDLTKNDDGVPYVTATEKFKATVEAIKSIEVQKYNCVMLDSLTQFGFIIKGYIEENNAAEIAKNKFFLYSKIAEITSQLVNYINDSLRCDFVALCQESLVKDEEQRQFYEPEYPGAASIGVIMGLFDEVYRLVVDEVQKDENGNGLRWLLTQPGARWKAKSRGNVLPTEGAHLGKIFNKIRPNLTTKA